MVAGVRKKHGETDRTGHINYNSTETQALRESLERQDALEFRREHGLVKHRKARNPVLGESTVCSTRGPEVEEDRHTKAKRRDGARPRTSGRGTPLTPRALRALEQVSSHAPRLETHHQSGHRSHRGPASRRSSDASGRTLTSSCSSTSRPPTSRAASCVMEEETWEEEVQRDLPLLDDPRVLPLACARLRDLRCVGHTKEDYEVLRARRAERFLAHAHAARHRTNNQATHEMPDHESARNLPPRPLTAPAVGKAHGSAASTTSSARSVMHKFGPAARGIPRGGHWKCIKKASDVMQRSHPNVPTPWALHYEEAPKSKVGEAGEGPIEGGKDGRRDRMIKQLQQRVGLILAQLTDVNERLEGLQKHEPPRRTQHAPPHFLTTTQALRSRAIKPKPREPKGRAFIP